MPPVEPERRLATMIEGPCLPVARIVALGTIGCLSEAPLVLRVGVTRDAAFALGPESQVCMAGRTGHGAVPTRQPEPGGRMVEFRRRSPSGLRVA